MIQFFLGIFTAFIFPSYIAIFTRHIDSHKEGIEWGMYFTLTDLSSAFFAVLGGVIAATIGFTYLIMVIAVLSIVGSLLLLPIRKYMKKK